MSKPLVTVVIGTFNKERYIEETLASVVNQTWPETEILVIDDASSDGTAEIIRSFGDRVRFIPRDENSGCPGTPRNQGMELANGKYVAFLDADDLWHPEKLARQVAFMEAEPELPFSHTSCQIIDSEGCVIRIRHEGAIPETGNVFVPMLRHCYVTTSTVMLRKDFFQRFGGMLCGAAWRTGEDYEYYLRVAAAEAIGFMDEVLASYRSQEEGESISQESSNWRGIPEHVPTLQYLLEHPESLPSSKYICDVKNALFAACIENAWYWLEKRQGKKVQWFLNVAFAQKPFSPTAWAMLARLWLSKKSPR